MNKKKHIIIVCIICIALIRIFTPYLGRPFLIYCHTLKDGKIQDEAFHLSNKVKKIELFSAHEPCTRFIRYCSELEALSVLCLPETIDINDISNPDLKSLIVGGKGVNWSSLNQCTELKKLTISYSNFTTAEDISELKELETLKIIENKTDCSLNKLNELKNLKELEITYHDNIDCEDFSQLDKLETLYLGTHGIISGLDKIDSVKSLTLVQKNQEDKRDINCEDLLNMKELETLDICTYGNISGLDKMDSVVSLTLVHPDREVGNDICEMDSLKELTVYNAEFSDEVESTLEKKGVVIEYK